MGTTSGTKWYERKLRILQFNFEDPYGYQLERVKPEDIVELAKQVNANALVFFARDPWGRVYYMGSRIYPVHPKLSIDFIEKLVELAHKNNIKIIAMIAHTSNKWLYEKHPDWVQRSITGEPIVLDSIPRKALTESIEWPLMCPNSPFGEIMIEEAREVLAYNVDAILLDSFRYQPDFPRACYCRYCRHLFYKETGLELPRKPDWDTVEWRESWKWRYRVVLRKISEMKDLLIKTTRGEVPLAYNSHPFSWAGRANKIVEDGRNILDIVFAENGESDYQPPGFAFELARLSKALNDDKPVWVSRPYFHVKRTTTASTAVAVRQGIWEAVMGDASPWVLIFLSAYHQDRRLIDAISDAYKKVELIEEYINDVKPMRYAAVVYSNETRDWFGRDNPESYIDDVRGVFYALLYSNVPVDYIGDSSLSNLSKISEYNVLVLANTVCVNDEAIEDIKRYVERGGGIVATYLATTKKEEGYDRFEFGLSEIFGAHYYGVDKRPWCYMRISRSHAVTKDIDTNLILIGDMDYNFRDTRVAKGLANFVRVSVRAGARVLGRMVDTIGDYGYEYELGRSPPPAGDETEAEGIIVNKYGKGRSVYFTVQLGRMFWRTGLPEYQKLIVNSVKWSAGKRPPLELKGPETVRIAGYKQGEDRIIIHLLNQTFNQRILAKHMGKAKQAVPSHGGVDALHPPRTLVPVYNIAVRLNYLENGTYKVYSPLGLVREKKFQARRGVLNIRVGKLDEYGIIVVDKVS